MTLLAYPPFPPLTVFCFVLRRTNDRTSITGSTGSSRNGSGLHRLAYRRKKDRLRPRKKPLWDTAAAAAADDDDPARKSGGRNPRPWPADPNHSSSRPGGQGDGRCTPIVLGAKLWSTQPTDDQHHDMSKAPGNPESTLGPTRLGTASVDGPWPPARASWRRATTWLSMHG